MKPKIIGLSLIIALSVSIVAVISLVGPIDISTQKKVDQINDWNRSGPFAINKYEYKIGEKIFLIVDSLSSNDDGSMIFLMPNGTTAYMALPFDGKIKNTFNYYFKPDISKNRRICSIDDLIGDWKIIFKGTEYKQLEFRITNETETGELGSFQRVC